jgi:signal transduction histidine kinase
MDDSSLIPTPASADAVTGLEAELRKAKEELGSQARLALLGQMSASVAHDLRNPLGTIRNAAYFLQRKVPATEPKWAEYLAIIEREVVACDQIIANMLEVARAREPSRCPMDLGELVRACFQRAKPSAEVRWEFQAAEPFFLNADAALLRQVLDNLIKNSLDALNGRGDILVAAVTTDAYDTISFSDSGPGVFPAHRAQLFEPLFSTKAKGTGLGLWICRQIVERHCGTIALIDLPGRGVAFEIHLPR